MIRERAVILARGLGTRMREATDGTLDPAQAQAAETGAKAMMPIAVPRAGGSGAASRPFLDYSLSALADAGYTDVCLVVAPDHEAIARHYSGPGTPRRLRTSSPFAKRSGVTRACKPCAWLPRACVTDTRIRGTCKCAKSGQRIAMSITSRWTLTQKSNGCSAGCPESAGDWCANQRARFFFAWMARTGSGLCGSCQRRMSGCRVMISRWCELLGRPLADAQATVYGVGRRAPSPARPSTVALGGDR